MTIPRVPLQEVTFPTSYGEDVLHGMALSPDQVYLYWELTEWRLRLCRIHCLHQTDGLLFLRGYERVQSSADPVCTFSTAISDQIGDRFIQGLSRGGSYFFQIGVDQDGFVPLLTSNVIDLPGAAKWNFPISMPEQAAWWHVFLTYTAYESSSQMGEMI